MTKRRRLTQAEVLEMYRVSLDNVINHAEIELAMANLGFDTKKIAQGKDIWLKTRQAFDANKIEDDETSATYQQFNNLKEQLASDYSMHRKKAKVIFRNDALTLSRLGIEGSIPAAYIKWIEMIRKFYAVASSDESIKSSLSQLKINNEDITGAQSLINQLEIARANYLKEKGESQEATHAKELAFELIDDWMSEFYAVAKIALDDKPQLLEVLGKRVHN